LVVSAVTDNQHNMLGRTVAYDPARLAWQAYDSGQPVVIDDYATYPKRRNIYQLFDLHAVADIPVMVEGRCLGILAIGRFTPNYPYSPADLHKGMTFAQLAGLVLENSALQADLMRQLIEREAAEQALRDSEVRYRTLVSALAEGVVLHDASGQIITCNAAAERMLGLSYDQLVGRSSVDESWYTVYEDGTPFPGEKHPSMVTLRTGAPMNDVVMGVHKPSGELTWLSINSQPMFQDGGEKPSAVVVSFTDITRRKQAEQRSIQLGIERKRSELLTDFIRDASHEFRTPLSIIQTSLYLLNRSDNPAVRAAKTKAIEQQIASIDRLVDMLVIQTTLDGAESVKQRRVDLNEVVAAAIERATPQLNDRQHLLSVNLVSGRLLLNIEQEFLITALHELIDNSARYTPNGGRVAVTVSTDEAYAYIEVSDNGVGIPSDELDTIFKRFYRLDTAHTTPGFGLGLSIVARVVERQGGNVMVASQPGVGSSFTVALPLSQP
jgi:PAS domain S-box-containing protein